MTQSLRLERTDLYAAIAAVVQMHADGLDRAAREDAQTRELLVGARPGQVETAYPSRGEVSITLNALLRAARGTSDRIALQPQRLNIVLAALTRFARLCRTDATATQGEIAAILEGRALDLEPCHPASSDRIQRLPGQIRLQLVGQEIAA